MVATPNRFSNPISFSVCLPVVISVATVEFTDLVYGSISSIDSTGLLYGRVKRSSL